MEEICETSSTTASPSEDSQVQQNQALDVSNTSDVEKEDMDRCITGANISVPNNGELGKNASEDDSIRKSNVNVHEELVVGHTSDKEMPKSDEPKIDDRCEESTLSDGVGKEMTKIDEAGEELQKLDNVIKTENDNMENENVAIGSEEKENTYENGVDDADHLDLENLFVEDTSGKKVFEFQVKYNDTEEENADFESAAMAQQVNCIVESLISSIDQDSTVIEPSVNTASTNYTRRSRGRKLTNSERQKAYRARNRVTYLQRERERKRRSYVPAHLRPPEILAMDRERRREYQREYNMKRKLKGSRLTDIPIFNAQPILSSASDCSTVVQGSIAQSVTAKASQSAAKGSTKSMRVTNPVAPCRPNKRKLVKTTHNIKDESTNSNKKTKTLTTSSQSFTGMCQKSKKKDNSVKELEKTSSSGKKGKFVSRIPESSPSAVPHVDHKLDLSGINYFELVKLRDACNYYIKQYEDKFLQQMNSHTASQYTHNYVNTNDVDEEEDEDDDNEDYDDNDDEDYDFNGDMDLSSDTEDSGYSGKLLKAKNVKRTQQVPEVSTIKRSERLKIKRTLKMNQVEVGEDSKTEGKRGRTKGKKQRKLVGGKASISSKTISSVSTKSKRFATETLSDKSLSTIYAGQQQGSTMSFNLSNDLQAVVKLEPIDQDDELLNNVLVDFDLSASKDKTRGCRQYTHYNADDTICNDRPRSYRAIIQKRYRERQKAKLGALYMEKERLRSRQYYVPAALMDKKELVRRREMTRKRTKAYRIRKKIHEVLGTENSAGQV